MQLVICNNEMSMIFFYLQAFLFYGQKSIQDI